MFVPGIILGLGSLKYAVHSRVGVLRSLLKGVISI